HTRSDRDWSSDVCSSDLYQSVPETSTTQWLEEHAPEGARIGYDPWLHTSDWVKKARQALARRGAELVAVDKNPIDEIWKDRPDRSEERRVGKGGRLWSMR